MQQPELDAGEAAFRADLEALRVAYLARLPGYRDELHAAWRGCTGDGRESDWLDLRSVAHRLSGSAPCYGLEALGAAARELDRLLSGRQPCREAAAAAPWVERMLAALDAA